MAKDLNSKITRWFLSLEDFLFQVQHCAGDHHGDGDSLSRRDVLWAQAPKAVSSELMGVCVCCDKGEVMALMHTTTSAPLNDVTVVLKEQHPSPLTVAVLKSQCCLSTTVYQQHAYGQGARTPSVTQQELNNQGT